MRIFCVIFFVFSLGNVEGLSSAVPKHLMKCYRANYTSTVLKPPLTIQLLIELVRKIEWLEKDALNLRMFTTSLLHGLRFDGIEATPGLSENEYLVPYRATGKQFYKYELLVDYLTSGKPQLLPYNSVNTKELCLLHEIISNSVHVWERGNEGRTCPELRSMSYKSGIKKDALTRTIKFSKCPIENGVVKTKWGTISPGHLISGISSSLQETTINLQKLIDVIQQEKNITVVKANPNQYLGNISNVWVSTIVGDLAEVTLQQAFDKPKLGNTGIWNNTHLPRVYYLKDEPYDMTTAELLGGLDGVIFASRIKEWLSILSRTRFSQLLDMYYSKRGIAYDRSYKACERTKKLEEFLKNTNLERQTGNVAKLLQELGAANQYLDEKALEKYAQDVVKAFKTETDNLVSQYNACEQDTENVQPIEIITILDQTWNSHKTQTLIGTLAEAADVSFYGSALGLINGQNGKWIANTTNSLIQLYDSINSADSWPSDLQLTKSLEAVAKHLETKNLKECGFILRVPVTPVILILANTAFLSEDDVQHSSLAIKSIKNIYPETRILFVTSTENSKPYEMLSRLYANDVLLKIEREEQIVQEIMRNITTPNYIVNFYCNEAKNSFEDYVTPGIKKFYEIHGEYIKRADFSVKFKGNDYGETSICAYDVKKPENKECRGITGNDEIHFQVRKYCDSYDYGCGVQFSAEVTSVRYKCAELDCRYPDQVRLDIVTTWTYRSGSPAITYSLMLLFVIKSFIVFSLTGYM